MYHLSWLNEPSLIIYHISLHILIYPKYSYYLCFYSILQHDISVAVESKAAPLKIHIHNVKKNMANFK